MTARQHLAGFTLLELLVVVAIISVLAAMLVPTIKLVQNNAKQTICMNNQQKIPMACIAYSNDREGYLPYSLNFGYVTWSITLLEYLENGGTGPSKVFMCPMDPRPWDLTYGPRTYSFINLLELNPPMGWAREESSSGQPSFHLSKFVHMSSTVLIAERPDPTSFNFLNNWQAGSNYGWVQPTLYSNYTGWTTNLVHRSRLVFGMADGRAEALTPKEVVNGGYFYPTIKP